MPNPVKLSKMDARRAIVRHHFAPCPGPMELFERLRSVQFDPIAPVGCNHDLVLQARVQGYRIGDWERTAYEDRLIYDGWDKQASLIPFDGWPVRRVFHKWAERSKQILAEHPEATEAILREIEERGPMQPKDFEVQAHKEEWRGSWYGPSLTKNILRRLWNTGQVMTAGRRKGQHLYDLTDRVVPQPYLTTPEMDDESSIREIVLDRHRAMGLLRLSPPPEVWASRIYYSAVRNAAIKQLVERGEIVPVEVEGMKGHATPSFLSLLDEAPLDPRVVFVAPLDQFVWDRKMTAHVFDFDYVWEIYVPEAKRRWGYYVLPVLFGNELVARVEFKLLRAKAKSPLPLRAAEGEGVGGGGHTLHILRWHWEPGQPTPAFWPAFEQALREFMGYCSATQVAADECVDPTVKVAATSVGG